MFTSVWFWVSFSAFFFSSNFHYYKSKGVFNGSQLQSQVIISGLSNLGLIVFWIIGLFVADSWWQPLAAFGISILCGGLIGVLIDSILGKVAVLIGAISPFISLGLTIASYLIWY